MNSNRLPGKILMKVNNKPMIDYLINRLKKINNLDEIVISTTKNKKDDVLIKHCIKKNYKYFRGSEKNVLKRVYQTAKKYKGTIILFITGDCPIIDVKIIRKILNFYLINKKKFDYVGNAFIRSFPDGMDAHVFSFSTLEKNYKLVKTSLEKEHVTLGIRSRPKKFRIKNIIASKTQFWPELGLTLDEKSDFDLIKKIILYFKKSKKYFFTCREILNLLRTKKREWVKINSHVTRKGYN